MLTLFKLLVGSGVFTSAVRDKIKTARKAATVLASLWAVALIAVVVGAVCLAASAFFALRSVMADYQAALLVGGGCIAIAGIMVLIAARRLKTPLGMTRPMAADERTDGPTAIPAGGSTGADPLVQLIGSAVQSPVVMTALALGIVAGRATKRSGRN